MLIKEDQIKSLAPTPASFNAGNKLANISKWQTLGKSERALWGKIKGSGAKPYYTQVDLQSIAFKCSCPSRQFPCKHAIGLMLLVSEDANHAKEIDEPTWVSEWLDKRQAKNEKSADVIVKEIENPQQTASNREKTQAKRLVGVIEGAQELELWLRDMMRLGLLELPNKPKSYFDHMAARMVDSKAPGLAGWIKNIGSQNFHDKNWEENTLKIIAKLFLLIRSIKNYEKLAPIWQVTIRNLAGWNQSSKELLANPEAETIKDEWLVIGQITEENEDITVQRTYLVGLKTNKNALILNFATRYSTFESTLLPGVLMEAEIAYFPSVQPYRAVVKMTNRTFDSLNHNKPKFLPDLEGLSKLKMELLSVNPWANDFVFMMESVRLLQLENQWKILDQHHNMAQISEEVNYDQCLKWLSITGNKSCSMAGILRNGNILPLGIFLDDEYIIC